MKYAVLHFIFIAVLFVCFRLLGGDEIIPTKKTLETAADATHYNEIRLNGYNFNPDYGSVVAFFPGFPYLWRFSGLNVYGICILNIVLFYGGIWLWRKYFNISAKELLLVLSVPSMLFMYVPYSEALFFFTSTLLLIGLLKNNTFLSSTGFLLSGITRSAANIFLPAMLLTFFTSENKNKTRNALIYSILILAGIGFVAYMQYLQTGYAWGFIQTQQHWQHKLQWPKLWFTSWGQYVWLDAAAFALGILCIFFSLKFIYLKLVKGHNADINQAILFSIFYLAGLTFLSLIMKGGSFFSLNRYLLASPCFAVALVYFLRITPFSRRNLILIFGVLTFIFALFHHFTHIKPILHYLLLTIFLSSFILINHKNKIVARSIFAAIYICNCLVQVYLLNAFLDSEWVG